MQRGPGLQFRMSDENLYARVVEELSTQGPVRGLWAKAYAEANGNHEAAQALYLRLRVTQLADERLALEDDARLKQRSESRWSQSSRSSPPSWLSVRLSGISRALFKSC